MIEALRQLFIGQGKLYKKFATVSARPAIVGETIVTQTESDGETVETTNVADEGDMVVCNPGGEEYIVRGDKFPLRYDLLQSDAVTITGKWSQYRAKGQVVGIKVDDEVWKLLKLPQDSEEFYFEAIWGELMLCKVGDMLVTPSADVPEVYRIEKGAFLETYKPA